MLFVYCSNEEYEATALELSNRYNDVKLIERTQSYHSFKPVAEGVIQVRKFSSSVDFENFIIWREED